MRIRNVEAVEYFLQDDGIFPNNVLPVLHYKKILDLPFLFPAVAVKRLFHQNEWSNNWKNGIYTYHHYHSVTHEVIGVCKGKTILQLGGEKGIKITIEKGDVVVIPAGVAHKNLGKENDVVCVGGYPEGKDFDMSYGKKGERPGTDRNIAAVPVPDTNPVFGTASQLFQICKEKEETSIYPIGNSAKRS